MKSPLLILLVLAISTRIASATAQFPEVLILDGKEEAMTTTPLEEYFEAHPKAHPEIFDTPSNTALWRGYIGTWEIRDDTLYLKSLGQPHLVKKGDDYEFVMQDIPLKTVFPDQEGPIKASWFSGVIGIPQGEILRYVHMGFASIYSKMIYLTVKDGRVIARRKVDNKEYGATRSSADMEWVALATTPPPDDGKWIDARNLVTRMPKGEFRTRGLYFRAEDGSPAQLWIPETPTTEAVGFHLNFDASPDVANGGPIEIVATRSAKATDTLKVISARELLPGETMHHPDFPKP